MNTDSLPDNMTTNLRTARAPQLMRHVLQVIWQTGPNISAFIENGQRNLGPCTYEFASCVKAVGIFYLAKGELGRVLLTSDSRAEKSLHQARQTAVPIHSCVGLVNHHLRRNLNGYLSLSINCGG